MQIMIIDAAIGTSIPFPQDHAHSPQVSCTTKPTGYAQVLDFERLAYDLIV